MINDIARSSVDNYEADESIRKGENNNYSNEKDQNLLVPLFNIEGFKSQHSKNKLWPIFSVRLNLHLSFLLNVDDELIKL